MTHPPCQKVGGRWACPAGGPTDTVGWVGAVELLLVRHGQSTGNLARMRAYETGAEVIQGEQRDADVALSALGRQQAQALGERLARLPVGQRPERAWVSPFTRAVATASLTLAAAGFQLNPRTDERLRDRDPGVLDGLTGRGIAARFPQEAARKQALGKLYYRPPGGESWSDVALRLRSVLTDIDRIDSGRRVVIFTHDAVVLLARYVCEGLGELDLVQLQRTSRVDNASLTQLIRDEPRGRWRLGGYNDTSHLDG